MNEEVDVVKEEIKEDIQTSEQSEVVSEEPKVAKRKYSLKKKYTKPVAIICLLLVCVIYLGGFLYYNGKFLSHTSINGIDVSRLTLDEAHETLAQKINNQTITLTFIDEKTETLSSSNAGIQYNKSDDVKKLYNSQNHWLWFVNVFSQSDSTIESLVNVDDTKLTGAINSLQHLDKKAQVAPENAKVSYKDGEFSITEEKNGSTINFENLKNAILENFQSQQSELNVFAVDGYILPEITAQDENLAKQLDAAKKYADVNITYETTSGDVVLDGNEVVNWLSVNEQGEYYRDDDHFKEKATEFVKDLSKKINSIGINRTITVADGRTVNVSGGTYGLKVDQEKEVTGLLEDIYANKKGKREAVTTGVQASTSNGGVGNTFLEVDLTNQHMYFVKNGEVVLDSAVVTGAPYGGRSTPAGVYSVLEMKRNKTLVGEIDPKTGKPEYRTPVAYWIRVTWTGIGFHDATWQSSFGGNRYRTGYGSHGCINMPYSKVASLYSMVSVHMPIVIHY